MDTNGHTILCEDYVSFEVAKRLYELSNAEQKTALECIFPELCESEDEKIRKTLKHYLEVRRCQTRSDEEYINCNNFLAWLEKQGTSYTKRDVDDAFVEGMVFAKDELEKQKSAWSKEEEIMIANIRDDLFCYQTKVRDEDHQLAEDIEKEINWLKSLKERYTWKPSDEQMNAFKQVYDWYNTHFAQSLSLNSLYYDLKKLKGE